MKDVQPPFGWLETLYHEERSPRDMDCIGSPGGFTADTDHHQMVAVPAGERTISYPSTACGSSCLGSSLRCWRRGLNPKRSTLFESQAYRPAGLTVMGSGAGSISRGKTGRAAGIVLGGLRP